MALSGNIVDNWKKFKQRFQIYLEASGASEQKTQACIFLHVVGDDALEVYNNFDFQDGDELKLDKILKKFDDYCTPKKNTTYERHKFFTCNQNPRESIEQYVNDLRTKAKSCEFGDLSDSFIRDRIICGITSDSLRERLLREQELTLDKAITMCRAAESTKERMRE
ncbi:MAG: hypothetical protein ABW185_10555 [Sedimenticola sp.]